MNDTRDTKLTIKVNDVEKQIIEKISEVYECSQAAAGRMLFTSHYSDLFGEIHPDALDRHDIDVGAIVRGEMDPDEIDDELKMDSDGPAQVPATDGGLSTSLSPSSHSPTYTPQDLATSGTALSWDGLKSAVDRHWDDELEIHPDRVEPETLKNNQGVTAKVIAGVLRGETDVIPEVLIETRIEEYLEHTVRRADKAAGLEYKINQYKPLVIEHLEAHPGTRTNMHYASPDAITRDLPQFVTNILESLLEKEYVLDIDDWADEKGLQSHQIKGKEIEIWLDNLADFRHDLFDLRRMYRDPEYIQTLIDSDIDYPEDAYDDPVQWLKAVCESWRSQYMDVDQYARYAAVNTIRESDPDLLESRVDRPSKAVQELEDASVGKQVGKIAHRVV